MHSSAKRNIWAVADSVAKTPDTQATLRQHREWLANFQRDISQISALTNKNPVVNGNGLSVSMPQSSFADDYQQYP
jgi:hypothetical protein